MANPPPRGFRRSLASVSAAAASLSTVFALGCGGAGAAKTPQAPEAVVDSKPVRAPLLWRIDGAGGPSYLFGTVHLGVSLEDVGPVVTRALDQSNTFISEADLNAVNHVELAAMATLPADQSLEDMMTAASWTELVRMLSPEVTSAQLERLAPWSAYTQVLHHLFGDAPSLDGVLTASAQATGKKLVFLETWDFQIRLLNELIEASDLKEILDPTSDDRAQLAALIETYSAGDAEGLAALLTSPEVVAKDPAEFKALFEDRNRAWVPILRERLRDGGAFVAVGAGHLLGEVGLLALLEEAGIKAVRVSQTD